MKEKQDLTTGNVSKTLILFALPMLLANLLQSFYSIVDMLVIGRIVGETGLAAISNASMISFIINSICIGVTMGGTVLVAQFKGANDEQGQSETVGTLFTISLIASLIVTILGLLVYQPLFRLLNVPAIAMKDACEYMQIICYGTVFVFGYNAVCSIMKGFGDSKSPIYFIAIATLVNIVLDVILVGSLGMGTKGAAYATIFSQGGSLLISIIHLKRNTLSLILRYFKSRIAYGYSDGSCQYFLSYDHRYAQSFWCGGGCRIWRWIESQHICGYALLGNRAGRYSYGWAEYGRKSYRTRQKDNRNRTVLQYYDYTDRNPICSNICQTSHYAV